MPPHLVYIDQYGLLGADFYWHRHESKGVTKEEILSVLSDDRVLVHEDIIDLLLTADKKFQERGWRMYVKEGYRSKELYELVYRKRVLKFGQAETDSLLNMKDTPHASGKTVDVALWDEKTNKEIYLRKGDDGVSALFIDFYKSKGDLESRHYQALQEYLIGIMQDLGFRLGTRREYFHFDYKLDAPKNYVKMDG